MSEIIQKEKDFLRLLIYASQNQKKTLILGIEKAQIHAIVQIVYNVLHGYRPLPDKDKMLLSRKKNVIRLFVSKGVSLKKRKELLFKYSKYILPLIYVIKSELL
jgi:hypothetical protein